jgi:hypothetical protein
MIAWNRFRGRCAYCSLGLQPTGHRINSVKLMLHVPLRNGGKITNENLLIVCSRCKADKTPPPMRGIERIPNVNTIADLVDRLIVEVHKLAWFENKKREEHAKDEPDVEMIAEWDNKSRDCCEFRSLLKRELNTAITEVVLAMQYKPLSEVRTFRPPRLIEGKNSIADIVSDMSLKSAERTFENPDEPPEADNRTDSLKRRLVSTVLDIQRTKRYTMLREEEEVDPL